MKSYQGKRHFQIGRSQQTINSLRKIIESLHKLQAFVKSLYEFLFLSFNSFEFIPIIKLILSLNSIQISSFVLRSLYKISIIPFFFFKKRVNKNLKRKKIRVARGHSSVNGVLPFSGPGATCVWGQSQAISYVSGSDHAPPLCRFG